MRSRPGYSGCIRDRRGGEDGRAAELGRSSRDGPEPAGLSLLRGAHRAQGDRRYANHPAVIGYQVSTNRACSSPITRRRSAVRRMAQGRYQSVDRLTRSGARLLVPPALGLGGSLASRRQPDSAVPAGVATVPQATLSTELIAWQAAVVREYARSDQFVTTCISYSRPQIADDAPRRSARRSGREPVLQDARRPRRRRRFRRRAAVVAPGCSAHSSGVAGAYSSAETQCLVTETNAQSIDGSWRNASPGIRPDQQAAFALLARGGRMVEDVHWHTLHFGAETYWGASFRTASGRAGFIARWCSSAAALKAIGPATRRVRAGR